MEWGGGSAHPALLDTPQGYKLGIILSSYSSINPCFHHQFSLEKGLVLRREFRHNFWIDLLPPEMKLRQGNDFTSVCHSVHRGVSVPASATGHMTRGWGISVQGSLCLGGLCPGGGLCPRGSLLGRPPDRDPPPYGNERAVLIPLECILVFTMPCINFLFRLDGR